LNQFPYDLDRGQNGDNIGNFGPIRLQYSISVNLP
jgi:hypothetical protein